MRRQPFYGNMSYFDNKRLPAFNAISFIEMTNYQPFVLVASWILCNRYAQNVALIKTACIYCYGGKDAEKKILRDFVGVIVVKDFGSGHGVLI